MNSTDWLRRVTRPLSGFPWARAPFSLSLNGFDLTCATEGRLLVARLGKTEGLPNGNDNQVAQRLTRWLDRRQGGVRVKLADLREWAGVKSALCCPFCGGSGSVLTTPIDGDFTGLGDESALKLGRLCGIPINRTLLALPLHFAEAQDGYVTVHVLAQDEIRQDDGLGGAVRIDADNLKIVLRCVDESVLSKVTDDFKSE
jgi:hypothetical protein